MMYGTKADHLIAMQREGICVPPFDVIPFEDIVRDTSYVDAVLRTVGEEDAAALSRALRQAVREQISVHYTPTICCDCVSVRSSCTLEDGAGSSFAGQFETYLRVAKEDIPARIADCVCALYSENVLRYVRERKLPVRALRMHVIVQQMVEAELSGVLFTANPQGILNESVIIVGKGTGDNVVEDRVETTAYYCNRTDDVYYYDGREDLLSEQTVRSLLQTADRIRTLFGTESDVEFCIADNQIRFLQARPITTLPDKAPLVLDNSNIVESYPNLSLPLTISFVERMYAGVFKSASRRILKNDTQLEKYADVFANMVGHANGRLYYKISNWYTMLHFLPFHKKIIPVWQEMLGVRNKQQDAKPVQLPVTVRMMTYVHAFTEILSAPKNMEWLNQKFEAVYARFQQDFRPEMAPRELLRLTDAIERELLADWDITLMNDTYAFIFTGLLKAHLRRKYPDHEARANRCIAKVSNIESMKPIRAMLRLAAEKDSLPEADYEGRLQGYIELYGDRSPEELKLESETFRTDPDRLRRQIDAYAADPEHLRQMLESHAPAQADLAQEDRVSTYLLQKCKRGIAQREISRLNRSRIFGMCRTVVLTIGETLAAHGCIDDKRDVFYLTYEELYALAERETPMQQIVSQRKAQYDLFAALPVYSRILFADKEFDKSHTCVNAHRFRRSQNRLSGTPCSNGLAEGEALVVEDIHKVRSAEGKILIAKMTDPGWVFLLASAKGIACEKGSLLSHSAIISRELKLPAVVGVEGLIETIANGDLVRLDGTAGTIEKIQSCQRREKI